MCSVSKHGAGVVRAENERRMTKLIPGCDQQEENTPRFGPNITKLAFIQHLAPMLAAKRLGIAVKYFSADLMFKCMMNATKLHGRSFKDRHVLRGHCCHKGSKIPIAADSPNAFVSFVKASDAHASSTSIVKLSMDTKKSAAVVLE